MYEIPTPYKTRIRLQDKTRQDKTRQDKTRQDKTRQDKTILDKKEPVQFTKDNEYYTPKNVVKYFGEFDYDAATTKEKAEEFGIKNYDTIDTNGLISDWSKYKRIWINPPFTLKAQFIEKAYETYNNNPDIEIYILFPIEFLTTKRFHNITKRTGGKLYIPSGRIPFESGLGKTGKSPAFGSVILKVQRGWEIELLDIDNFSYKQLELF